jgi:predicted nucleic acid-binding protein
MGKRRMKAVFDTNILIDYLNGAEEASKELSRYETRLISVITLIEVMAGVNEGEEAIIRAFLSTFQLKGLTEDIADSAIRIRKAHKLKVPDAIVYATAREEGCIIVTRNTKDLKPDWPDVRVPYRL